MSNWNSDIATKALEFAIGVAIPTGVVTQRSAAEQIVLNAVKFYDFLIAGHLAEKEDS